MFLIISEIYLFLFRTHVIYKDPVSFDKNCSLLMRANSVLYQERRKIYYFSISPFSLKNTVLSAPSLSVRTT